MSRIGVCANIHQPNAKCLNCKYWKPATKDFMGYSIGGYCKTGYCKKDSVSKKGRFSK